MFINKLLNCLIIILIIILCFCLLKKNIIEKFDIKDLNFISAKNDTLSKSELLNSIHNNCVNVLSDNTTGIYDPKLDTSPGCYIVKEYTNNYKILSTDIINHIIKSGHIIANKLGKNVSGLNMRTIVDSAINKTKPMTDNLSKDLSEIVPEVEEHVINHTKKIDQSIPKEVPLAVAHAVVAATKVSIDKSDPEDVANKIISVSKHDIDLLGKSITKNIGVKVAQHSKLEEAEAVDPRDT